ncbi:hypothetical protein BC828DRAFT_338444, partial [Blastocladiella britannica]
SDTSRQSLTDRAHGVAVPQAFKSDQDIAQEQMRGKADKAQAAMQPESEKSYIQQAADKVRG